MAVRPLCITLALLGLASAAAAFDPPTPSLAWQAEKARILVAPPLDRPLVYDVTIVKFRDGRETSMVLRQSLRFTRSPTGYTLTIKPLRLSEDGRILDLASPGGIDRIAPNLRPLVLEMTFDMSGVGELARVHDWPALKRKLTEAMDRDWASEKDLAKRAETRSIAERVLAPYLNRTAEQAPEAVLKGWPSLFGFGDIELVLGKVYEVTHEAPSAVYAGTIPVREKLSLVRDPAGGGLRYHCNSHYDPAALGAAASGYIQSLGQSLDMQRTNIDKGVQLVRSMRVDDDVDILFDATTGLPVNAATERRVTLQDGGIGGERVTVQRAR